ncbi:MAG TPA: protein kinase [Anaeromyxobacter sp.]
MPLQEEQSAAAPFSKGVLPGQLSSLLREIASDPGAAAAAWRLAPGPGEVIGRFQLVREVGRGGFGVVYEALDTELGRTVAFKAVRAGGREVQDERLLREAEAAARLCHPNIVTLFDVGRSEHGPYLVLEFLKGETLGQRLEQGPLGVVEALRIAVEVAKGVAHAHANGVVHRDLTPGNVFLCRDGQVKVLDLGMAHAFGRRKLDGGTPAFMAPEQWRGAPEDERTDVFALGVMLYRMLAHELPFPDGGGLGPGRGRPAARLDVQRQPAVGELIAKMLELDAVKRPRDMGEVLAALSIFHQELIRATPAGSGPQVAKRRRSRLRLAALVTAGLAVGAGGALLASRVRDSAHPAAAPPSIAVLPFADLSPQHDQEYFSDGLAEAILDALAQIDRLRVIGRTSSFSFKGRNEDVRSIGRKLGVRAVLEGSVRKEGNRVRVTAHLVDTEGGHGLWAGTYDRELTGIFAIQDQIASAVAEALQVKLMPPRDRWPTSKPEAYDLYLLGHDLVLRGTVEDTRRAVATLEKALSMDPTYAPAQAQLVIALGNLALTSPGDDGPELARRAAEAADRAVALGPDLALAFTARGWVRAMFRWDWAGAQADAERAVAMRPNDIVVHDIYAIVLEKQGRLAEATAEARKGLDIDPLDAVAWDNLGAFHTEAGEFELARKAFARSLEISPGGSAHAAHVGTLHLLAGDPAAALAAFERDGREAFRLSGIAMALHDLGREREARRALEALESGAGRRSPYLVAQVHARRGDPDRAFEWLERALARRDMGLRNTKVDPLLRGLHRDRRWSALLLRMHLPAGP